MILIILTVIAVILESDPDIYKRYQSSFWILEIISLIVFSIEYIMRVWPSGEIKKFQHLKGKIKYILTPMAIIDLLAILPALLGLIVSRDLMILRGLRLIRIFKLTRYSRSMSLLTAVLRQESVNIVAAFFVLTILILIAAIGMHLVEGENQQESFGTIPKAIWWATVTLTTVGYGDVVPISVTGKVFGIVILMSGIGMAALPAGIAAGFTKEINRRKEKFRNKVIHFFSDGILDKKERNKLKHLAHDLAISQMEVQSVIREIKQMQLKLTKIKCPHCASSIEIENYSDHIHIKHHKK